MSFVGTASCSSTAVETPLHKLSYQEGHEALRKLAMDHGGKPGVKALRDTLRQAWCLGPPCLDLGSCRPRALTYVPLSFIHSMDGHLSLLTLPMGMRVNEIQRWLDALPSLPALTSLGIRTTDEDRHLMLRSPSLETVTVSAREKEPELLVLREPGCRAFVRECGLDSASDTESDSDPGSPRSFILEG